MNVQVRCNVRSMNPVMLQVRSCVLSLAPVWWFLSLGSPLGCFAAAPGPDAILYNRDIRPILTENCFACHGPDKNQRKAKLRLDVRDVALERGAIVPGKPAESKLVDHIFSKDADDIMPPPATGKSLNADQKESLKKWIAAGAQYEPHWSYIKLQPPPVPHPANRSWVRTPIDAFILQKLEAK